MKRFGKISRTALALGCMCASMIGLGVTADAAVIKPCKVHSYQVSVGAKPGQKYYKKCTKCGKVIYCAG